MYVQSRPLVELLQHLRTVLEMRSRFPSVVLVLVSFPLDLGRYLPYFIRLCRHKSKFSSTGKYSPTQHNNNNQYRRSRSSLPTHIIPPPTYTFPITSMDISTWLQGVNPDTVVSHSHSRKRKRHHRHLLPTPPAIDNNQNNNREHGRRDTSPTLPKQATAS